MEINVTIAIYIILVILTLAIIINSIALFAAEPLIGCELSRVQL